jgi:hyperosmotically inducible periplasmic protein
MRQWAIAVLLLGLAMPVGCTRTGKAQVREGARDLGDRAQTAARSAGQAVSNVALAAKVKTALSTRKGLNAGDISVEAQGPVVTLKGEVNSQAEADLAVHVAQQTEGVQSVTSELMLRVPARGSTAPRAGGASSGRS